MGLFGRLSSKTYGCDPVRAPNLSREEVGTLMEMESLILKEKAYQDELRRCVDQLLCGDNKWAAALFYKDMHESLLFMASVMTLGLAKLQSEAKKELEKA